MKTIITRAGEARIITTGDPFQIDHPYVDVSNNGLVHVVNAANSPLAAHIARQGWLALGVAEEAANLSKRTIAITTDRRFWLVLRASGQTSPKESEAMQHDDRNDPSV